MPVLTVVIATYERRRILEVTLRKLAQQTWPVSGFEVIVVDDGSNDGTGDLVRHLRPAMPYSLRYVPQPNRGPGAAQNRGIREAAGDLVLLIADDIHLEPDALEHHVRFHHDHPDAHFAALGRVLQSPDLPVSVFQRYWDPFRYYEMANACDLPYPRFWACHISLKRDFVLANGLFREYAGAAHEDVELGYRLCQRGLRLRFLPQALGYHCHPESLASASARAYERGRNWELLVQKVPDPQLWVFYQVLSLFNATSVRAHYSTFRARATDMLRPSDRNPALLLFRHLLRFLIFNGVTVPYFWLNLLAAAERHPWLTAGLRPFMYRGAVFYHFRKGWRDHCAAVAAARRMSRMPFRQ